MSTAFARTFRTSSQKESSIPKAPSLCFRFGFRAYLSFGVMNNHLGCAVRDGHLGCAVRDE